MQEVLYAAACEPYFMTREIEIVDFNFEKRKIRAKLKGENFESRKHGGEGKSQKFAARPFTFSRIPTVKSF